MHSSSYSFHYSRRLLQTLSRDTTLAAPCVRYWKRPRQRATMYSASHRSTRHRDTHTHTHPTRKRRIHHANSWQNKVLTTRSETRTRADHWKERSSGTNHTALNSGFPDHPKAFEFSLLLPMTSCAIPLNLFKTATWCFEEMEQCLLAQKCHLS